MNQETGIAAVFDFGALVAPAGRASTASGLLRRRGSLETVLRDGLRGAPTDGSHRRFLQRVSRTLAGRPAAEVAAAGEHLFRGGGYGHLYPEAWQLVRTHATQGHTVILTTSLTRAQVAPYAAALGIETVLCTELAEEDGILTGYVAGKTPWRTGKSEAVRAHAERGGLDLSRSYAYSASATDLPLLAEVGHPGVVNPDPTLSAHAAEQQWPVLRFAPRRAPTAADAARTVLGLFGLLAGSLFGVLRTAHTRDRRRMADALMVHGTRWALTLLGVRVRISDATKALSPRPAVFLFNHQSQFDVIVVPHVLVGGVTGIGKKELTRNPIFGPLLRFVGVTFIDRSDTARAKAALEPVAATLRGGLSLAVAPEGTRSYTPEPGPFKKGAFHIAIQAGVPIIPVVIRNAGEIARRNSMIARPGTVDVAILDPIDVGDWDPNDLDARVAAVRELFVATLLDWPKPRDPAAASTA
ncbi:HAD-IB family hydrolase [Nocardia panacis]|uniref:HAD-IB family hydrolase n=1 Tax=Nocardia panacis TaxID=2340916 RepID=UPI001EEFB99A|nr:HAD-IB family hydrolase [Nocardia panacis]